SYPGMRLAMGIVYNDKVMKDRGTKQIKKPGSYRGQKRQFAGESFALYYFYGLNNITDSHL
ncbi:MAG: hypothetical protein MIO92_06250, partial [Methanosarcinaceae archaeon]|nr:hypothetical protein [Methanosarcinaceae archaeon]